MPSLFLGGGVGKYCRIPASALRASFTLGDTLLLLASVSSLVKWDTYSMVFGKNSLGKSKSHYGGVDVKKAIGAS